MGKGVGVAERRDGGLELVFQIGFGIQQFALDLGPIKLDEFRVVDGMRAEVDAMSEQFPDLIPS